MEKTIVVQDTLATAVSALINKTLAGVDKSAAFMEAQLPDYIVQLLMWHGIKSAVACVIGVVLLSTCLYGWKMGYDYCAEHAHFDGFTFYFPYGIASCFIAGAVAVLLNITWLQIWIAPKVWLVEYAASLVK